MNVSAPSAKMRKVTSITRASSSAAWSSERRSAMASISSGASSTEPDCTAMFHSAELRDRRSRSVSNAATSLRMGRTEARSASLSSSPVVLRPGPALTPLGVPFMNSSFSTRLAMASGPERSVSATSSVLPKTSFSTGRTLLLYDSRARSSAVSISKRRVARELPVLSEWSSRSAAPAKRCFKSSASFLSVSSNSLEMPSWLSNADCSSTLW